MLCMHMNDNTYMLNYLGIMTQTILAIPINDMVSSAITTPTASQQQLQQQLLYHSSNNVRQKNIRQQLNQTCQPSLSLPLNRYFQQQQTTADDTTTSGTPADNANNDNNNCQYFIFMIETLNFHNHLVFIFHFIFCFRRC